MDNSKQVEPKAQLNQQTATPAKQKSLDKAKVKERVFAILRRRKTPWAMMIGLVFLLTLLFFVNQLTIFGHGIKGKNIDNQNSDRVCPKKTVQEFALLTVDREKSVKGSYEKLEQFAKAIETKSGYQNDANCLYLLIKHKTETRKFDEATNLIVKLRDLLDRGAFVDSRYIDVSSIDTLNKTNNYLKALQKSSNRSF